MLEENSSSGPLGQVRRPDIDEKGLGDRTGDPEKLVRQLAEAKADVPWHLD